MNPYDLIYDLLNILIFHIISSCSCFEHLLVFQAAQLNEFLEQLPEARNKVLLGCHMMSPWPGSMDLLHPFDHGPMAPWPRFAWTTRRVTRLGTGQRVVIRCSHFVSFRLFPARFEIEWFRTCGNSCGHLIHIKSVEGCPGQQCKMSGSGAFDFSNSCIETLPKPLAQSCHKETFPAKAIDGVTTKLKFCNLLFNTPAGLRCNEFRTYWR